jgi:hypothetical protein
MNSENTNKQLNDIRKKKDMKEEFNEDTQIPLKKMEF